MSDTQKEFAIRWFEEVWNKGRREAIEEMLPTDAMIHDGDSVSVGPKDFLPFFDRLRASFSNIRVDIHQCISEGDLAHLRWTGHLCHTGDFEGMAPTGKQLHVTGMSLFRFADGRIAEAWQNWDMLGLLHQIQAGVHPKSLYLTVTK